ncbi:MAG TPA: hypothetical protein VN605_11585, partial [Thermoanaerobaculia bacterium]|nr:hypothetical protein [Thermoanaerobaculia bacterium]
GGGSGVAVVRDVRLDAEAARVGRWAASPGVVQPGFFSWIKSLFSCCAPAAVAAPAHGSGPVAPAYVRLDDEPARARMLSVPEGHHREFREADGTASFEYISICTGVYIRARSGRVVLYHCPGSALNSTTMPEFEAAIRSIGAWGSIERVILHTRRETKTSQLEAYFSYHHQKRATVERWDHSSPMIKFDGSRAF